MTRPEMLPADYIRELTQHHHTTTKIDRFIRPGGPRWDGWKRIERNAVTTHPPLLDQLQQATQQSKDTGAYGGGVAKSKPAARLDALALLTRIDTQSTKLATDLGVPALPLRKRLQAIGGKLATTPNRTVKSWWVAARCTTGWEDPPYTPQVPCPNVECERWSTIRIRVTEGIATCIECGETWDEDQFTYLGDYVRWAAEHLRGPKHWLVDADGFPVECTDTDCHTIRVAMAERQAERAKVERASARGERIGA